MRLTKIIIHFSIILALNSCVGFHQAATVELEVPEGPPEYRTGWYDGCRSGFSIKKFAGSWPYNVSFGSGVYQHDPVYQSAWASGFLVCNTSSGLFTFRHPFANSPLE